MGTLIFDKMDKSPNGKQQIARGGEAVQLSIFRMITTPRGNLPDFPDLGFEMEHFFGLSHLSEAFTDLSNEFINQIRKLVGDENVECSIRRLAGGVIRFEIMYTLNGKMASIGMSAEKNEKNQIIFKNITLK